MSPDNEVSAQVTKVVTVWAAIGITSWAEAASFVAFCYSFALLSEWVWKKVKPLLVARGWIADRSVYKLPSDEE